MLGLLLHLLGLIWTFYGLCILCDEHLVPAVDVFIKQFQVPEEVAAVTLVAFGSAAPELFLNSVSAIAHTSDLSMSAILGSGMIAFGLIPALCILSSPKYEMRFRITPILRECGFYLFGLGVFLLSIHDGQLATQEAVGTLLVYALYVLVVIVSYYYWPKPIPRPSVPSEDHEAEQLSLLEEGPGAGPGEGVEDIEQAVITSSVASRSLDQLNRIMTYPIRWVFQQVFPSLDTVAPVPLRTVTGVLLLSIVFISITASAIVSLSEALVQSLDIGSSTMGATLVALGAEIPDTISAMALARNGYHDGALAGAIGSQVINISLGVGLPALFVCLSGNGYLSIARAQADSLWLLTCLLFVVIVSYVSVTLPLARMWATRVIPEHTVVSKSAATVQVCVWALVYFTFIYLNEG